MSRGARTWRRWAWAPLTGLGLAAAVVGGGGGGYAAVADWFRQLCTACIGLN